MSPLPTAPQMDSLEVVARRFPVIDAASLDACVALLHASSAINDAFDAQYARHGIARGRFRVLVSLYKSDGGGLTPAQLAQEAGVTRAAMTGLVDALVEQGMATREDDAYDRRTYRVRLTDRGHAFLHGMFPDHFRRMAALIGALTTGEQKTLKKLLAKVTARLHVISDERPKLGKAAEKAAPERTAAR